MLRADPVQEEAMSGGEDRSGGPEGRDAWESLLEQLALREGAAREMGGPEKLERQQQPLGAKLVEAPGLEVGHR